jgi:hypothetical protein
MTQHTNPGTDTTINPIAIDDSYRERKRKEQLRVDWVEEVRSRCYSYTEFYGGERVIRFDELEGVIQQVKEERRECYDAHTGATAQESVDAANKERDDLIRWLSDYANHRIYWSGNGCAYDIKTKLKEIALLQAGRK